MHDTQCGITIIVGHCKEFVGWNQVNYFGMARKNDIEISDGLNQADFIGQIKRLDVGHIDHVISPIMIKPTKYEA